MIVWSSMLLLSCLCIARAVVGRSSSGLVLHDSGNALAGSHRITHPNNIIYALLVLVLMPELALSDTTGCGPITPNNTGVNEDENSSRNIIVNNSTLGNNVKIVLPDTKPGIPGIKTTHFGSGDIRVDLEDAVIITPDDPTNSGKSSGIYSEHNGGGNIQIAFSGGCVEIKENDDNYDNDNPPPYGIYGGKKGTDNEGNVSITVSDANIFTNARYSHGVHGFHEGNGNISLSVSGGTIETSGDWAQGISGHHTGTGNLDMTVSGATINTFGVGAYGIFGHHRNSGKLQISVSGGTIETIGKGAYGIYGSNKGNGNLYLSFSGSTIETNGENAHGIYGRHIFGFINGKIIYEGNIDLSVSGGTIETSGNFAYGIYGRHQNSGKLQISVSGGTIETIGKRAHGIYGRHENSGKLQISVSGGTIETIGKEALGIYGYHKGTGDISIVAGNNHYISTKGDNAWGIYGLHDGTGDNDLKLTISGGTVETSGSGDNGAHGIYGLRRKGTVNITIVAGNNHNIITRGNGSHGIYGHYQSKMNNGGDIDINVMEGMIQSGNDTAKAHGIHARHEGTGNITIVAGKNHHITTKGVGSHGIYALHKGTTDQNRSINVKSGNIKTNANDSVGVYIGDISTTDPTKAANYASRGSDGYLRQSVTVNGTISSADKGVFLAGGGKVYITSQGKIISESDTVIKADGDIDHPDSTGSAIKPKLLVDMTLAGREVEEVIGKTKSIFNDGGETTIVVNGVMLYDGTNVTGRLAPNGFYDLKIISSFQDGDSRNFSSADFKKVPAPRPAVFEVLPASLILMTEGITCGEWVSSQGMLSDSPAWGRIAFSQGKYRPSRSTFGASFDLNRHEATAGGTSRLGDEATGCLAIHRVGGTVDVFSPMGGGMIKADGYGLSTSFTWEGDNGFYARANASALFFDLELSSDQRNLPDADGKVLTQGLEVGQQLDLDTSLDVKARGWINRMESSLDSELTGPGGVPIAFVQSDFLEVGAGLDFESTLETGSEPLKLYGTIGMGHMLEGRTEVMYGSGKLATEGPNNLLVLDTGISRSGNDLTYDLKLKTRGLGTEYFAYSAMAELKFKF